ncbi:MAG: hypothetical protein ACYDBO_02165 [Vulcanimicrobiaceae bacterium]
MKRLSIAWEQTVEKFVRAAIVSRGLPTFARPAWLGRRIVKWSGVRITQSSTLDELPKVAIWIHDRLFATVTLLRDVDGITIVVARH